MAQIFDIRLAITFATIVREGSFTAAARELGAAQPWVSEQLRKLEEQLGYRLLTRTSRRLELTGEGVSFLPFAERLRKANAAAQAFAAAARTQADQTLRIGAVDFSSGTPERLELIERFVERHPLVNVEVHAGPTESILQRLEAGQLDLALVHLKGHGARELESITISRRYAHLLAPSDHPLAALDCAPLPALRGASIVVSPGRSDPKALAATLAPLANLGVRFVNAPEAERRTIQRYARLRRLLCFHWETRVLPRTCLEDSVCVPLQGAPIVSELGLMRQASDKRAVVEWFWRVALELSVEAVQGAGVSASPGSSVGSAA